jgi:hypothetical protein
MCIYDHYSVFLLFTFFLVGLHVFENCLLPIQCWTEIQNLGKLPRFKGLEQHFCENLTHYRKFFDSSDAHREPMAGEWNQKLDTFQKMLFLRCIRVDKSLLATAVSPSTS